MSQVSRVLFAATGEGAQGAHAPSFSKPKRKSSRARESQAIADCFFSRVTIFLLNREKTFDKPRENVRIWKDFFCHVIEVRENMVLVPPLSISQ